MTQTAYAIQTIQETFTLCQKCSKKLDGSCAELCPEAEEFVNQDYVALRELPVADLEYIKEDFPEIIKTIYLTEIEKKISKLLNKSFSLQEISYLLGIAMQTVYNNVCSLRKKHNNS